MKKKLKTKVYVGMDVHKDSVLSHVICRKTVRRGLRKRHQTLAARRLDDPVRGAMPTSRRGWSGCSTEAGSGVNRAGASQSSMRPSLDLPRRRAGGLTAGPGLPGIAVPGSTGPSRQDRPRITGSRSQSSIGVPNRLITGRFDYVRF